MSDMLLIVDKLQAILHAVYLYSWRNLVRSAKDGIRKSYIGKNWQRRHLRLSDIAISTYVGCKVSPILETLVAESGSMQLGKVLRFACAVTIVAT